MLEKRFLNILDSESVSDTEGDLEAYSFCASDTERAPDLVVWPEDTEQAARIIRECNQTRTSLIIRGTGTSQVDGCIGSRAVILCTERMNKIIKLDSKNKSVEVQSGTRVSELNRMLAEFKLVFPLTPFNPARTIGAMLALDERARESENLGSTSNWVDEVEFIDGTGKLFYTYKKELVAGREGINGFITKAKLRVIDQPVISIDVLTFTELSELLAKIRSLKKDSELFFLEFLDASISSQLHFGNAMSLIIAYSSLKGKQKTVLEVRDVLGRLESVHSLLRSAGGYYIKDPMVSLEKSYDLISWCNKNSIPLHGHAGIGLFYTYFAKDEIEKMDLFKRFIKEINGRLGMGFGIGSLNTDFVSQEEKKAFVKIKDEFDYNNVLNPGKIISYR